ncbi:MAG: tetratricopeptide repeat protein [Inquilinaceae bacterium]
MTDVFREIDEELRQDRAKRLWKKYGIWITGVAALILIAAVGYVGWGNYQDSVQRRETASLADALTVAETDPQAGIDALSAFAENAGAGRETLARLQEAALHAEIGDRDGATAIYRALAADGGTPALWRDLALLLAVWSDLEGGDAAALTQELAPLAEDDSPWRFSARELTGLLMIESGDRAGAQTLFVALAADPQAPSGIRRRAEDIVSLLAASNG